VKAAGDPGREVPRVHPSLPTNAGAELEPGNLTKAAETVVATW